MNELIELLPLYAELQGHPKLEIVKHYVRACVAHATSPLQAEIEALRVEVARRVEGFADKAEQLEARAERLAEALRETREYVTAALQDQREAFAGHEDSSDIPGIEADLHKIDALLREQENDDA